MGCRQAFDIDLAAFLAEPRGEAFAAFRAHYPRCAVCAAEVRAWTELEHALGAERHPAPEALAGYAELSAAERAGVDRHVASCPGCREELRLLDAFDPALLAQPAPAAVTERSGPSWLEALARLLWHPAFAYGVAILVVAPILWRTQGPGRSLEVPTAAYREERAAAPAPDPPELQRAQRRRAEEVAVLAEDSELAASEARPAEHAAKQAADAEATRPQVLAKGSLPGERKLDLARAEQAPALRAESARPTAQEGAPGAEDARVLSAAPATAPAIEADAVASLGADAAGALAAGEAVVEAEARGDTAIAQDVNAYAESGDEAESATLWRSRSAAQSDAAASEEPALADAAASEEPALADAAARKSATVAREAGAAFAAPALPQLAPVALATAPALVSVRVPVERGGRREVTVAVSRPDGELVIERGAQAVPERAEVAVELPREVLAPGRYRVELRDGEREPRVFELPVVER